MYYIYVVQNSLTKQTKTGKAKNILNGLRDFNIDTGDKLWKLVYVELSTNEKRAIEREHYLGSEAGWSEIENRI